MPTLLGTKLRFLRHRSGMTQVELSSLLSLASYTHITKIEAGQRAASLDLTRRIARVFGMSTDYLLRDAFPIEQPTPITIQGVINVAGPIQLFGAKLRHLREKRGLSQSDLARAAIARQAYISNLEAGRKEPSPELVVAIADFFGVSTDYLVLDELSVGADED